MAMPFRYRNKILLSCKRRLKNAAVVGAIQNCGTPIRTPRSLSMLMSFHGRAKECTETWSSGARSAGEY